MVFSILYSDLSNTLVRSLFDKSGNKNFTLSFVFWALFLESLFISELFNIYYYNK